MAGTVDHLPAIDADTDPRPTGADHPMRVVTRAALDPEGWTDERRADVTALFDQLSAEWHTRDEPGRHLPVFDALDRGAAPGGRCLELGSGTGLITEQLLARFDSVIAADLAMEMLRLAPSIAPRVRVDGSVLPMPDASVDVLLLMNMLLFPEEADRVLRADGAVVWVNSRGDRTPIHLPAEGVVAALPGEWTGTASAHGSATWCVARRRKR